MVVQLNPYDACVANKMIDNKQCTIAWYIYNTKISQVKPEVVTQVIKDIEETFGKMTIRRGHEHVFVWMNIRYTEKGTVVMNMKAYLDEAHADCGICKTKTKHAAMSTHKNSILILIQSCHHLTKQKLNF
jgi:hypothetical protein